MLSYGIGIKVSIKISLAYPHCPEVRMVVLQTAHYLIQTHLERRYGIAPALEAGPYWVGPIRKRNLENAPHALSKRPKFGRPASRQVSRRLLPRSQLKPNDHNPKKFIHSLKIREIVPWQLTQPITHGSACIFDCISQFYFIGIHWQPTQETMKCLHLCRITCYQG